MNMSRQATRGTPRPLKLLTLLIMLSMLLVAAPQAAAENRPLAGEGSAPVGTEEITTDPADPPPTLPFCLEVVTSKYTFPIEAGVFAGHHDRVVYTASPLDASKPLVTFTTNENYFIAPEGTYGDRDEITGECDPATFGPLDPVATTVTVTTAGSPPGAGIDCGPDAAEYYRVGSEMFFEWTGRCDIVGNTIPGTGYTPEATQHLFEATLIPPAQPTAGNWTYAYSP